MLLCLLAFGTALGQEERLIRVDDPNHPDALARSTEGAVLAEPPAPGVRWRYEHVPHTDGWVAEEGIAATNAEVFHDRGATGAGVSVAVFDLQWFGAGADPSELGDVQTHDCWASSSCELPMDPWYARFSYEEGIHGYACAEVIRDMAPDVDLHLVRVNGQTTLENAVDWAVREEIDLISMSLSFFNNSFYDGTGPISDQASELAEGGVLMLTSAGNYAESHWRGPYIDADQDGLMDFNGDNGLWLDYGAGDKTIYVTWNQYAGCGLTDLSGTLRHEDGSILGVSDDDQDVGDDHCEPLERVQGTVSESGLYKLEVSLERGSVAFLEVDVYSTSGDIIDGIPEGSIADPAASPDAIAVAAVDAVGYAVNDVESFSSWGTSGKPEIAGPDGLTTTSYGVRGFYGTSASTPATTALVALVMSDDPDLSAYEAYQRLELWALDDGDPTFSNPDPRWGAGKARLPLDPQELPCGRRPLIAPLLLLPFGLWCRRRGEE